MQYLLKQYRVVGAIKVSDYECSFLSKKYSYLIHYFLFRCYVYIVL